MRRRNIINIKNIFFFFLIFILTIACNNTPSNNLSSVSNNKNNSSKIKIASNADILVPPRSLESFDNIGILVPPRSIDGTEQKILVPPRSIKDLKSGGMIDVETGILVPPRSLTDPKIGILVPPRSLTDPKTGILVPPRSLTDKNSVARIMLMDAPGDYKKVMVNIPEIHLINSNNEVIKIPLSIDRINLLDYKDKPLKLVDKELSLGSYSAIKLIVSEVLVINKFDRTLPVKIPNKYIDGININTPFKSKAATMTVVALDFKIEESIKTNLKIQQLNEEENLILDPKIDSYLLEVDYSNTSSEYTSSESSLITDIGFNEVTPSIIPSPIPAPTPFPNNLLPKITSITPDTSTPGSTINIYGTNFDNLIKVEFSNKTLARIIEKSLDCLTVQVPYDAVSGNISVTTMAGTSTSKQFFTVLVPKPQQPPQISVRSVSITPNEGTVNKGDTLNLIATVIMSDGTTNNNVIWQSSSNSIATIDSNGVLNALLPGVVTITATSILDNTKSTSINLNISNIPIVISQATNIQSEPVIVDAGSGESIIVWRDTRNDPNGDIYAQKLDFNSNPLWESNGVAVCTDPNFQSSPLAISDGAGGVIIAWKDDRNGDGGDIYVQRLDANGTPKWTLNGKPIISNQPNEQSNFDITSDGTGGAIITWQDDNGLDYNIKAERIDNNGNAQWNSLDGLTICGANNSQFLPKIINDGSGGAIITWVDNRSGVISDYDIYAYRVSSSGGRLWSNSDGELIANIGSNMLDKPELISDGNGGAIICWQLNASDIYVQRINSTGALQWNGGFPLQVTTDPNSQYDAIITTDGSGGAIITWKDIRNGDEDIFAQKVSADGVLQWLNNGIPIVTATGNQFSQKIISDGNGGAIITWEDTRNDSGDIYAQRIDLLGNILWTSNGVALGSSNNSQNVPNIINNGSGGAIVVWQDARNDGGDIYGQRINSSGDLY